MKSFSRVGWIGLGNMGSRIAIRLRNAGYPLIVYNRDRSKAQELLSQGAELAASPPELAAAADIIFSCLSDATAIQSVYFGAEGVLRSGMATKLVVNAILGVGMQAIAEATSFGVHLGLSRNVLFDTLAKTAVIAPAHLGKLATAKRNDYTVQFPLRLMRKDFDLILSKAADLHVEMPATAAAGERNAAEAARGAEEDFSAVIRLMEELSDPDVKSNH